MTSPIFARTRGNDVYRASKSKRSMTSGEKSASRSIFLHRVCWKKWLIAQCRKHLSLSLFLAVTESKTISWMASRVSSSGRVVNFVRVCIPLWSRIGSAYTIRSWFISVSTVKPSEESSEHERARAAERYTLMRRRIRACRACKKKRGFEEHVTPVRRGVQWHAWLDFAFHRLTIDRGISAGLRPTRFYRMQHRTNTLSSPISLPPAALQ